MPVNIPTITTEDLVAFRDNHLSSAHHSQFTAQFITGEVQQTQTAEESYYEEEEDDGLGYYADGTKRTLTDEQIAIFRWSEVWQEYKKRVLKPQMNKEEEEEIDIKKETPEPDQQGRPKRKWAPQAVEGLPYDEEDVQDWESNHASKAPKIGKEESKEPQTVNRDGFLWPVLGSS